MRRRSPPVDPTDLELALNTLVRGVESFEGRGGCRSELGRLHVYLGAAYIELYDATMGDVTEEDRKRQASTLRRHFEHALLLDRVAARRALSEITAGVENPLATGLKTEFGNAEAFVDRTRAVPWLTLGVGAYAGVPTQSGQRGCTVGPYFFVGVTLGDSGVSVGLAEGLTTGGGFAGSVGVGLRYRLPKSRLAVFLGYGSRVAATESVAPRRGWAAGVEWVIR